MTRLAKTIALGALLALSTAAPAAADSIAYVKDGNVWLATPDGARQHQVTRDGGYSYVSQADDGTLIAKHGQNIRRLERATGAVTADFATPVSSTPPGSTFEFKGGPIDPAISPDGSRIAYGYNAQYTRYDPYCGYYGGCSVGKLVVGTGYSRSDRLTAWDEPGFKQHSGWQWPSWIDSQHTLISHPAEILNKQFWVDTVGDDQNGQAWFRDDKTSPTSYDAEVNRQQTGLAALENNGYGQYSIVLWKMNGPVPAEPSKCLTIDGSKGEFDSPSWSPAGNALAYGDNRGILVAGGLDMAGCDAAGATERVVVPGGTNPDWGPAGVPAGTSGGGKRGGGGKAKGAKLALTLPKGARLGRALSRGLTVKVGTGGAGRLTAVAKAGRARVASGKAKVGKVGRGKVKLTFSRKGRRKLSGAQSATLSLKLAFKPAKGGAPRTRTAMLTLTR